MSEKIESNDQKRDEKLEAYPAAEEVRKGRTFVPDVDILETDGKIIIRADMPGVAEDGVDVRLEDNVLSITGRVGAPEADSVSPVYSEYQVGDYERRFSISSEVDAEKIQGRMALGVLEIELPKRSQSSRRIAVSAG